MNINVYSFVPFIFLVQNYVLPIIISFMMLFSISFLGTHGSQWLGGGTSALASSHVDVAYLFDPTVFLRMRH